MILIARIWSDVHKYYERGMKLFIRNSKISTSRVTSYETARLEYEVLKRNKKSRLSRNWIRKYRLLHKTFFGPLPKYKNRVEKIKFSFP